MFLFCNVGWMERYQGLQGGDAITGGGAYVKKEGRGHEIFNFSSTNGTLYGYVQPPGREIDIERLGARPEASSIDGITVVWTATRPTGGTAVVGWYKNATVFRHCQKFRSASQPQRRNGIDGYWIRGPLRGAKLLSVDERTCEIPRQVKGGMGRANVWYADAPESASIVKRVNALLSGKRSQLPAKQRGAKNQDQERKSRIEKAAIRACCAHFERLGYFLESVEKDNLGWDLNATSGKTILRIEVKGLSGTAFAVELTPNEYNAFFKKADDYRLAVVITALERPQLFVCRYSAEERRWLVEGQEDRSLEIQIKSSASIRCN